MALYSSTTWLVALVPLAVVVVDTIRRIIQSRIERKGCILPPGPPSLPLLGSVLSVDTEQPWLTYTEWQAKYGDIVYFRLLDSDVIVLNSISAATDLLEKRSRMYSDRPVIATADPYGHDCDFGLAHYGDHWRLCRRIIHQTFHAESALGFHPMQIRKARQLILNLLEKPDEYPVHLATFSAGITTLAIYNYEPSPRDDPIISISNNYLEASMFALTPEKALLLKMLPFLPYVPEWLPGSWMKRETKKAQFWRDKMLEMPYQYVEKYSEVKDNVNATGMVLDHLIRMEKFDDSYRAVYKRALKHAAATALNASMETTGSTLMIFMLAMVKNPHVWKRAQKEIDTVIGTNRLPEFDDRPSLPYVDAVIRETFRWMPGLPLAVPHAVINSDVYNGYFIPKGATVIPNIWAMSHDEVRYPEAEKFKPERFLDSNGMLTADDPADFVFGFGRRVCPGRYTAHGSVWSAVATMLATVDFNLAKDADGKDITFTPTFANGITHHPDPFPCSITPRAHISKEVLMRVLTDGE